VSEYVKVYKTVKCDKDDLQSYLDDRGQTIKDKTPEDKRAVVAAKKQEVEQDEARLKAELETAAKAYETAKAQHETKQANYANLKDYQKNVDKKLKDLKALRDDIENAYTEQHLAKAYFLVVELEQESKEIRETLKTPDKLRDEIYTASNELQTARKDLLEKKEAWEAAEKKFKEKPDRRKEILKRIGDQ
jgi:hypothetical protein